ncbi:deoxyribodipyrimidine photo-lyase [Mariprofundus erugo]|uniref:cryptochrome/photolyase family protein n=1 Tax=Mariprofundus erugo TaxID=2528639 RepID=UPI0010FDBC6E|nr:deoxyribodipyrimidine photo-lyase [Mariprofundus erugo]TLS73959.1 deoxyribodipyrimidine photo-lyase [Mariprofundus erugo]
MKEHGLVVFRRDLRLYDHTALAAACRMCKKVSLCFVLDPEQLQPHAWRSGPGLCYMQQALLQLHARLREYGAGLWIVSGKPADAIAGLSRRLGVDSLFINRDYTPFSRQRDQDIQAANAAQRSLYWYDDALLVPPGHLLNGSGEPYQVFGAFFRAASRIAVAAPDHSPVHSRLAGMAEAQWVDGYERLKGIADGQPLITGLQGDLTAYRNYQGERDFPALDATTHWSVQLKFGTVSVRELYSRVWHELGAEHPLIRQLYWRDFFYHIAWHYPHVFGHAFHRHFDAIQWQDHEALFQCWCEGKTGFPIVDAGMRELAESGFMHNRVRMIVASFLVKDLHIDWRKGEAWFARHLVDYDPAINNGNWQWAASTGCDAQPWFRIFNPWLQQKRFDADCRYIRRWLPALSQIDSRTIHQWGERGDQRIHPLPVVDHKTEAALAKQIYRHASTRENHHVKYG